MKKIIKTVPYPLYDIESISEWLEENAQKGLFLTNKGFRFGFAVFEKRDPRKVKYRFVPATDDDFFSEHAEPAAEIMSDFGWEHICALGKFHLYFNADGDAEEPITDTDTITEALKKSKIRLIGISLPLMIMILNYLTFKAGKNELTFMIPLWFIISNVIFYSFAAFIFVKELIYYNRFISRIKSGKPRGITKKNRSTVFFLITGVIFIVSNIVMLSFVWYNPAGYTIGEYGDKIPFPVINDFLDEDAVPDEEELRDNYTNKIKPSNYVSVEGSFFIPSIIKLHQRVNFRGETIILNVYYFETRYRWVADKLAGNYVRNYMTGETEVSEKYSGEESSCFVSKYPGPWESVVIVYNERMIYASVYSDKNSDKSLTVDDIAAVYYDYLKDK